eukprot:126895-Prymnesium_polylepis.1
MPKRNRNTTVRVVGPLALGGSGRRQMLLIILVTTQRRTLRTGYAQVAHVSNGASDLPTSVARPALSTRDVGVAACERLRM